MTLKEIVNLLPNGHPLRLEIDGLWEGLIIKSGWDCDYARAIQEYGDYNVVGISACDNDDYDNDYDYTTLWLKIEKQEDDNPYRISDCALFKDSDFNYLETYKHYTILKASLNPHNSEYVIQEIGFKTRWASLTYCKKYIKEQLGR